jgi:anti-sigma B factor antagonist
MEILESKVDNLSVVSMAGRLDTVSAPDLEKAMDNLINAGQVQLVINLQKTEYISSSGLRILLAALKKVRKVQGDIKLVGLSSDIRTVFDTAGFSRLFNIFDTVEAAAANYKGS